MKVLILTDERCGGVSFQIIVSSFLSENYNAIDDPLSHFWNIKRGQQSWIKDLVTVDIQSFFDKYEKASEINLFELINFIFSGNIDVIKISINNITENQFNQLIKDLKFTNDIKTISLFRQDEYQKILSKCRAEVLKEEIGHQAFDEIKTLHEIEIPEELFNKEYNRHLEFLKRYNQIDIPEEHKFYYENFYGSINEAKRLQKLLGNQEVKNTYNFCKYLLKDYKKENVIVKNISQISEYYNQLKLNNSNKN